MKPKPNTEKFRAPVEDWLDRVPAMIPRAWDEEPSDPVGDYADLASSVREQDNDW
ncbi:MAG: hypothetical protein ACK4JY_03915 [Brevundimonas sp.]|uniref:hypothetical protein n=1 Tax=Brevundimonas sp. TaxID=1871086 RepID=UPI0039194DC4